MNAVTLGTTAVVLTGLLAFIGASAVVIATFGDTILLAFAAACLAVGVFLPDEDADEGA